MIEHAITKLLLLVVLTVHHLLRIEVRSVQEYDSSLVMGTLLSVVPLSIYFLTIPAMHVFGILTFEPVTLIVMQVSLIAVFYFSTNVLNEYVTVDEI